MGHLKLKILNLNTNRVQGAKGSGVQVEKGIASGFTFGYASTGRDADFFPGISMYGKWGLPFSLPALVPEICNPKSIL